MTNSAPAMVVVHHVYRSHDHLVPVCGVVAGSDRVTRSWHTGHDPLCS